MKEYLSLIRTVWECKYNIVWIPKCRRKILYEQVRIHLGQMLRHLANQKESRAEEGHLMPDHVHMLISISPKYSVAKVVGFIEGKSAIHVAREFLARKKNITCQSFWARGYFVSTDGRDEETIRQYIKKQVAEDQQIDQLQLFD